MTVNFIPPSAKLKHPADRKLEAFSTSDITLNEKAADDFSQVGIRIVGVRDKGYAARVDWLKNWLPDASVFTFDDEDISILSQARDRFAVIVLHGTDIRRMARIIQDWRRILPSKLIVAVVPVLDSRKQNDLLLSGADAVLDVTTPMPVSVAWLHSLILRTRLRRAAAATATESADEISVRINATPLQRRLIKILFERLGHTVEYKDVLSAVSSELKSKSVRTLHVAICNLRKKLPPNCRIENIRGKGYKATLKSELL